MQKMVVLEQSLHFKSIFNFYIQKMKTIKNLETNLDTQYDEMHHSALHYDVH